MKSSLARITGAIAAAAAIGSAATLAPPTTAVAAPAVATAAGSPATSVPASERNKRVSRSMTGVRPSAYVGKYFSTRYEATRRCIVRKESGGNYRVASSSGRYRGAYQFNSEPGPLDGPKDGPVRPRQQAVQHVEPLRPGQGVLDRVEPRQGPGQLAHGPRLLTIGDGMPGGDERDGMTGMGWTGMRMGPMLDVPRDQFEELVGEALDSIPPELGRLLSNCVILVEDDVPPRGPQPPRALRGHAAHGAGRLVQRGPAGPDHDLPAAHPADVP